MLAQISTQWLIKLFGGTLNGFYDQWNDMYLYLKCRMSWGQKKQYKQAAPACGVGVCGIMPGVFDQFRWISWDFPPKDSTYPFRIAIFPPQKKARHNWLSSRGCQTSKKKAWNLHFCQDLATDLSLGYVGQHPQENRKDEYNENIRKSVDLGGVPNMYINIYNKPIYTQFINMLWI